MVKDDVRRQEGGVRRYEGGWQLADDAWKTTGAVIHNQGYCMAILQPLIANIEYLDNDRQFTVFASTMNCTFRLTALSKYNINNIAKLFVICDCDYSISCGNFKWNDLCMYFIICTTMIADSCHRPSTFIPLQYICIKAMYGIPETILKWTEIVKS